MKKITQVVHRYEKSSDYKTCYVDGVYGGLTPQGNINCSVFIEKLETPVEVTSKINENGTVGKELSRIPAITKDEEIVIIREIQGSFTMNLETAKVVRDWIEDKIKIIEQQTQNAKK